MPLDPRVISIRAAVGCLFVIAFISWFSGLEPLVCCKRAGIGAVAVYVVTMVIIRLINHILISAFVESKIRHQNGEMSESAN
jgi:hypothetical protein